MLHACTNISGDEFCNAIIHGELDNNGKPHDIHTAYANEMVPAIISCWIKKLNLSQLPANHRHNPALALLITKLNYETVKPFTTMPESFDGLYNVTNFRYVNTSNTDYHIGFEYSMYMFDPSMDRTVAICGIRYYVAGTRDTLCLATTFTLIRYNSTATVPPSMEPPTTTIAKTTPTEYYTPTTEATTPGPDVTTTTECCNQTPDEIDTPTSTTPIPPETTTPMLHAGETVSLVPPGALGSGPLVTVLSSSTAILVLLVVILVLAVAILWVKLRTVSADLRLQKATYNTGSRPDQSEIRINKAVSNSEGERNESSSLDTKL